jgi:hypothetical protein
VWNELLLGTDGLLRVCDVCIKPSRDLDDCLPQVEQELASTDVHTGNPQGRFVNTHQAHIQDSRLVANGTSAA